MLWDCSSIRWDCSRLTDAVRTTSLVCSICVTSWLTDAVRRTQVACAVVCICFPAALLYTRWRRDLFPLILSLSHSLFYSLWSLLSPVSLIYFWFIVTSLVFKLINIGTEAEEFINFPKFVMLTGTRPLLWLRPTLVDFILGPGCIVFEGPCLVWFSLRLIQEIDLVSS